jgi:hypothetical protein
MPAVVDDVLGPAQGRSRTVLRRWTAAPGRDHGVVGI